MFKYKTENELTKYIAENIQEILGLRLISIRQNIDNKKSNGEVDIVAENANNLFLIEVKRFEIKTEDIEQLSRYISRYKSEKTVRGILISTRLSNIFDKSRLPKNISVNILNSAKCEIKRVNIYLSSDLHSRIKSEAYLNRLSFSEFIDKLISDYLDKK